MPPRPVTASAVFQLPSEVQLYPIFAIINYTIELFPETRPFLLDQFYTLFPKIRSVGSAAHVLRGEFE